MSSEVITDICTNNEPVTNEKLNVLKTGEKRNNEDREVEEDETLQHDEKKAKIEDDENVSSISKNSLVKFPSLISIIILLTNHHVKLTILSYFELRNQMTWEYQAQTNLLIVMTKL